MNLERGLQSTVNREQFFQLGSEAAVIGAFGNNVLADMWLPNTEDRTTVHPVQHLTLIENQIVRVPWQVRHSRWPLDLKRALKEGIPSPQEVEELLALAFAQDLSYLASEPNQQVRVGGKPWSDRLWWPLSRQTAARYGIPVLYDKNGPLAIYDSEMGTHAREYEEALSNSILNPDPNDQDSEFLVEFKDENPEAEDWLGHCDVTAADGLIFPQPVGSRNLSEVNKKGILVAATKGNIAALEIPRFSVSEAATKKGAVVDLFGRIGRWFRMAWAYNPNTRLITVTALGITLDIRVSDIKWSHVPFIDIEGSNPARPKFLLPLAYLINPEIVLKDALGLIYSR